MTQTPIRVLLVEDSATDALLARDELSHATCASFEVRQIDRLEKALKCLSQQPYDVVLLDLNLPDSDGLATFSNLRAAAPKIPVVVLSHRNDEKLALKAVQAGAQDYLVKGGTEGILVRAIRNAIERSQADARLRASEERYLSVVENLPYFIWRNDRQGRITFANEAFLRRHGKRFEELEGHTVADLLPTALATQHMADDERVMASDHPITTVVEHPNPDTGQMQYLEMIRTPLHDEKGVVNGVQGIFWDVTDRKLLEDAKLRAAGLEVQRQAAEAANQAKSEFLSRVSHELRTPLNAMLGYAQLLDMDKRHPLDTHQRDQLKFIQKAGWHLVQLIEDVLDLSRIEARTVRVDLESVDVHRSIAEALQLVTPALATSGLAFTLESLPNEAHASPAFVQSDRTRLTQVLVNLLTNAIKYNVTGGSIRMVVDTTHPEWTRIEVSDTGRGMDSIQLGRIFEPFNRLGLEQSEIVGSGIGLVITQQLVKLMKGEMEVKSELGKGSTFSVLLRPANTLSLPSIAETETNEPQPAEKPAPAPDNQVMDVLYIEDNAINAMLMDSIVSLRQGFRLHVASTASEGAALAKRLRPALMLLDLHLPDGSGMALLHRLRTQISLNDTKIVVVSADATKAQIDLALAAGASGYLTKPIKVTEVLRVLDETPVEA